ncbi:DEAD/DEAH box helicase [Lactobacillus johnsonii]
MKVELFPFQENALKELRAKIAQSLGDYQNSHTPQVISFTSPTGSGKTIIMSALIEDIYLGDENYTDQSNAIFVWISDSPELNQQSKDKIDRQADKISLNQCITVSDESFDQEVLDDGHIYFLNTQKLSRTSNLTSHSDTRQYTIWETLQNTIEQKSDRLYLIIDEAHRGMRGREAGRATTIMQKFIKGSKEIHPFPVVIGMSATTKRFRTLVTDDTTSTLRKVVITPDEVRASGLLKDRIIVTYPEKDVVNRDMAILQAAADAWKDKCVHWDQYCREQHHAYVNPIFVVQVQNGTTDNISDTDLSDCLRRIETRTGFKFKEGEVVHTFGQTTSDININGLKVKYEEPSRINDNKEIKVVLFKENLSTGWDCPRAETMISFRRAVDATYIAQLLGRMIRTPTQGRIQVDETLNDVRLFLPHFDVNTVNEVVDELQNSEGADIPTEVVGEELGNQTFDVWSVYPSNRQNNKTSTKVVEGQTSIFDNPEKDQKSQNIISKDKLPVSQNQVTPVTSKDSINQINKSNIIDKNNEDDFSESENTNVSLNRPKIIKAINDMGLLTYNVRSTVITNYLISLYRLAHLLTQSGLDPNAVQNVLDDIVKKIHAYVKKLKEENRYDDLAKKARQFKLSTQAFDVFGKSIKGSQSQNIFTTTDTDIDRQFRQADIKLGKEGVGNAYGKEYYDENEPDSYEIDVILYASDKASYADLLEYAKNKFHALDDQYRRYTNNLDEKFIKQYNKVVSDGDIISKHNFRLPETINVKHESKGKKYYDHLFVNNEGYAKIELNGWESGVIDEEEQRDDFVCWLRNPPRKPWSLSIPYKLNGIDKPAYPDFLIVRKDDKSKFGYVVDILEPHNQSFDDNLGKAQGFAEYARENTGVGRIELIRKEKNEVNEDKFKRLDLSKREIREKVLRAINIAELNHIFDKYGKFDF